MSHTQRQWLLGILSLLVCAATAAWWFANFEQRVEAKRHVPKAWSDNPLLAAERLLTARGYKIDTHPMLHEALLDLPPQGTILIAQNGGLLGKEQEQRLLAWVRQGNTLIAQPKWRSGSASTNDDSDGEDAGDDGEYEDDDEQATEDEDGERSATRDPFGGRYGVSLNRRQNPADSARKPGQAIKRDVVEFTLPGGVYPLQIEHGYSALWTFREGHVPTHADANGEVVRIYQEGRGRVVLLAQQYFENNQLVGSDHAELLLGIAGTSGKHFIIVQGLEMPKWHQALWTNFKEGLIGAVCVLALFLWMSMRRFGTPLPEPLLERRSLVEHIDASGRWLWRVPGGREILLNAARAAASKAWRQRAPHLLRQHPDQQIDSLAEDSKLPKASVIAALRDPPGKTPIQFTRQIHTLRLLRKTYER